MDFNRAVSTLLNNEQQRRTSVEAIKLIQTSINADNLKEAEPAIFAAEKLPFDSVRQRATEIVLDNIKEFESQCFDETFYSISEILDTKNLKFDTYERSEVIRADLLTILLKLLIYIQKEYTEKDELEKAYNRYSDLVVEILSIESCDSCPDCKIQTDKCIYRFAVIFKHFLSESQITELSESIIKNFTHNEHSIRSMNLQAFTQLHICVESKNIQYQLQELFPVILSDQLIETTVADCFFELLTQHIDRHVYAHIFAIPLLSNFSDEYAFRKYIEAGEVYTEENAKFDKFLSLQNEIEQSVTGAPTNFDEFIEAFNAQEQPHFDKQLELGCRVIAQQILEKELDAILQDLLSVELKTKQRAIDLLCNLIILSFNFTTKFSQKFVAKLPNLLHDQANQSLYDKLLRLMTVMCSSQDLINNAKQQVASQSAENCEFVARIYGFLAKLVGFKKERYCPVFQPQEVTDILWLLTQTDYIFNEDFSLCCGQLFVCIALISYDNQYKVLENVTEDLKSGFLVLLAGVYEKLNSQKMFDVRLGQLDELLHENSIQLLGAEVFDTVLGYFNGNPMFLDFFAVLKTLDLQTELLKTDRLEEKCEIFSELLLFSRESEFGRKNAEKSVNLAVKLLKVATDFDKNSGNIRNEALLCVQSIVEHLELKEDELLFLINGTFACTTWKHGARSPECLVSATEVIEELLKKQIEELGVPFPAIQEEKCSEYGVIYDKVLTRCCVELEDDWQVVREENLKLIDVFIEYIQKFGGKVDELGEKLVFRLDDANEKVTIEALSLLLEVIEMQKEMFSQQQIAEMIIMHCDDPNHVIREKCIDIGKIIIKMEPYEKACLEKAKEMNWQYLEDKSWLM